jgi:hypothetical protein
MHRPAALTGTVGRFLQTVPPGAVLCKYLRLYLASYAQIYRISRLWLAKLFYLKEIRVARVI